MSVVELVLAGLFALGGLLSLRTWLARDYEPVTSAERVVYALHVTARVGLWFAFAGAFVGYALVENPYRFRWYVLVLIGLAGVQMLTSLSLARGPGRS